MKNKTQKQNQRVFVKALPYSLSREASNIFQLDNEKQSNNGKREQRCRRGEQPVTAVPCPCPLLPPARLQPGGSHAKVSAAGLGRGLGGGGGGRWGIGSSK